MKFMAPKALVILSALVCFSCGKKESAAEKQTRSQKTDTLSERSFSAEAELQRAVRENDTVALRRVIFENVGINLNRQLDDGETLLTFAIKKRFPLIRNILLEKGAHPDLVSQCREFSGQTPLMIAASLGDTGTIMALLDVEASINNQDWLGDTALHKAIKNEKDESARALIYAGADLQIENDKQESPLEIADRLGRKEVSDYLRGLVNLELGAPTMAVFKKILTEADIVNYRKLVALHKDVILEYEHINPLVIAIEAQNDLNSFEIANSLLALKLSPNGPANADFLPLGRAVFLKKRNFAELLLRYRADVNALNGEGRPPLYYAIQNNDEKMVDLLMNNGADPKLPGFRACRVADAVQKRLATPEERFENQQIQSRLGCFFTR